MTFTEHFKTVRSGSSGKPVGVSCRFCGFSFVGVVYRDGLIALTAHVRQCSHAASGR